jgi:putative ABC transport system ATP-binding protein
MASPPSSHDGPRVECVGVEKSFRSGSETLAILRDIDLAIAPGESVAILGPSGSGKSTLLGLMAGLDRPTRGSVRFEGRALEGLGEDELARVRRRRIGFVFQSFHLFPNLTALENVRVPLELTGVEGAEARARELLGRVGLAERLTHYPAQLSGGEMQRVALARAFGPRPALVLADEPTGNLDAANGSRVLELLEELQRGEGTTLVLVTHDAQVAARAGRRVHLEDGRVARIEGDGPA